MSIRYIGQIGQRFDVSNVSSNTITTTNPAAIGDYLIMSIRSGLGTISNSVSDTSGNTWTRVNTTTTLNTTAMWTCYVTSALAVSSTITVVSSGSAASRSFGVWAFGGISRPSVVSAIANGSSLTTLNTGNLTPTQYSSLLFSSASVSAANTFTAPSGFTRLPLTNSTINLAAAYVVQPSMSSLGTTWTWTTSGNAAMVSATLTPDGGDFLAIL